MSSDTLPPSHIVEFPDNDGLTPQQKEIYRNMSEQFVQACFMQGIIFKSMTATWVTAEGVPAGEGDTAVSFQIATEFYHGSG